MRRLLLGMICIALALAGSLQPARTQGTQAGGPAFRVAWLGGLTGRSGPQQQATLLGFQLAAKRINAGGGILGRPVEVVVFDHQSDPARAVRMVQQDVLTQHFDAIFPGGGAVTTGPMLPFISAAKIFALAPYLGNDPAGLLAANPYFFEILPSQLDSAAGFANYISKLGVKKLGILYQSDAYGIGQDRAFEAAVTKVGIPVVAEAYDPTTVDITPSLLKLKADSPDHLFVVGFGAPAGHYLNSMDKIGWNIPAVGDLTMGLTDLASLAPARTYRNLVVQTMRINAYVPPAKRSERLKNFLADLKRAGPITQGLLASAPGWDAMMLIALAAQRAGSADTPKMTEALERLHLTERQKTYVVYNEYVFTPASHVVVTPPDEYAYLPWTPLKNGVLGCPASGDC